MQIVTTAFISGKELQTLGIVTGSTIQSVHVGKDIMASFKTLVGGELSTYHDMIETARRTAISRMVDEAEKLGADAVINVRLTTSSIMQSAAEVLVYGTAVKFL